MILTGDDEEKKRQMSRGLTAFIVKCVLSQINKRNKNCQLSDASNCHGLFNITHYQPNARLESCHFIAWKFFIPWRNNCNCGLGELC